MRDELKQYYSDCYSEVANGGVGGRVQSAFHRAIERPFTPDDRFEEVLELGATNAEHLSFVRHQFSRYTMLDINDSPTARKAAAAVSTGDREVNFVVGDAEDLASVEPSSVDRLISMCLLHHLSEPDDALRRWRDVVRPGGSISVFLPCDPGMLWRVGRSATTFRRARARGYTDVEVRYLNGLDHRNHFGSLLALTARIFQDDHVRIGWAPFPFITSWNVNLYATVQIRKR